MHDTRIAELVDPAEWAAATYPDAAALARVTHCITGAEAADLAAVCDGLAARGLGWHDTGRQDFAFGAMGPVLQGALSELQQGRGFALLRGLPLGQWPKERARLAAWGMGTWLGQHVSQTVQGTRLIDVSDTTGKEASPRQYRTSQELRLHTDPASDIIGLACLQDAKAGGESVLTSAIAVHNAMQRERPDLLQLLYDGFHWHRFGEGRPQDGAYSAGLVPVFAQQAGQLSCRYVRTPIAAGHKEAGVPLTDAQIEALDCFDRLAASPALRIAFRMQPGDLLLVNNLAVLHARTQFEDHPEVDRRRHMLRLWVEGVDGFRPVPRVLNFFNGGRCGIPYQEGQQGGYDVGALVQERAAGGVARLGL